MEGTGRGRARGRRIIDLSEFRLPPPLDPASGRMVGGRGISITHGLTPCPPYTKTFGRGFSAEAPEFTPVLTSGRGMAVPSATERGMPSSSAGRGVIVPLAAEERHHTVRLGTAVQTTRENSNNAEEDAKEILERELTAFENRGNGCLIRITLNFFAHDNNVEFYIDKVLNSALRSTKMVVQFAKCLKLITFLKIHGEQIKTRIFSKLQSIFQKLPSFADIVNLNQMEKLRLFNFCTLIGQIYFRFRPLLEAPDRYHVLAPPAAHCMLYLLQARGVLQLSTLVNLINVNYKSLCQQAKPKMDELCVEVHRALVTGVETDDDRLWILCAVDHMTSGVQGNLLPHHLSQFYYQRVGSYLWGKVVVESPVQLLADIPPDITLADMDRFDVDINMYNLHKYAEL